MKYLLQCRGFSGKEYPGKTKNKFHNHYQKGNMVFSKKAYVIMLFIIGFSFLTSCSDDDEAVLTEPWKQELQQLRNAVSTYDAIENAINDGYDNEFTGYRTQMGFHYLNGSLLDDTFEAGKPEVLLYAPYDNDSLRFVAVEYAVPIADMENPPPAPEGFTGNEDVWEINTEFKVWTLHVWVGLDNPNGIFIPKNPVLP